MPISRVATGPEMPRTLVAAGSNIDAERNLRRAASAMQRAFPGVRFSSCYANAAVGFAGDDFINCVAAFTTELDVASLLSILHTIESDCGRPRDAPKWAPRAMDLDVLLYGDFVGQLPGANLPRPDLVRRPYMLGPAAEVAPDFEHPLAQLSLAQLWSEFDRDAHPMRRLALDLNAPALGVAGN